MTIVIGLAMNKIQLCGVIGLYVAMNKILLCGVIGLAMNKILLCGVLFDIELFYLATKI